MNRKLLSLFLVVALVGIVLFFVRRCAEKPTVKPDLGQRSKPTAPRARLMGPVAPPGLAPREIKLDPHRGFSVFLETKQQAIAFCIRQNSSTEGAGKLHLSVRWDGVGTLVAVNLRPDPGSKAVECVREILSEYAFRDAIDPKSGRVGLVPSMRPYEYSRILVLK